MTTIRPFDSKRNYTPLHNYLYDVVMRSISHSAMIALLFFIRQTDGWGDDEVGLSYADIKIGTNIKSDGTVSKVIQELLSFNYITVKPGLNTWEPNRYALNADLEIEDDYHASDYRCNRLATTKIEVAEYTPTPKNEVAPTSKIEGLYKEGKKEEKHVVAQIAQATEQQSLFEEPLPEQPKSKRGRKPNSEKTPEQLAAHQEYLARKREIEAIWIECIGVKPVHFGETAKSSKALAEAGYTGEQVRGCFKHMLERKFWRDKFNAGEPIKLASVANELPTWLQVSEKEQARKQAEQQRIEQERARRAQQNAPMSPEARAAAARTAQEMRQRMQQAVE